jgi:His/Glu/Gln/Arg/opine family amino acid ABC transporter permease subunit
MDWAIMGAAVPQLFTGLWATVRICALAMIFGSALGIVAGVSLLSRPPLVRWIAAAYVDVIRGTPLLIQLLLIYFALPSIGVRFDEFWAGVTALSINAGGFIAEAVRGAISSIDPGQSEAAKSIGMTRGEALRIILLPQAARAFLPPMTNELISLVKGSAILSVISVYELTRAGQAIIASNFVPVEIYLLLAVYYYALISGIAFASRAIERRMPG